MTVAGSFGNRGNPIVFAQFASVCRLIYKISFEQRWDYWQQFQWVSGRNISYMCQAREPTKLRAKYVRSQ